MTQMGFRPLVTSVTVCVIAFSAIALTWSAPRTWRGARDAPAKHDEAIRKIIEEITKGPAYEDLKGLVGLGPRLSGSPGAERAVQWALSKLSSYGFDRVWSQPMKAPHWI